jgi:large subunit ribosomal protein L18
VDKKLARLRRATKTRHKICELGVVRLTVHRTPKHIYVQIIKPSDGDVVASASTIEPVLRQQLKNTGNKEAAITVGKTIAERAMAKGIAKVAFDRSGYKYHGRVKALADAAREGGLQF